MEDNYLDLHESIMGIYIPSDELLKEINIVGWLFYRKKNY